MFDHESGGINPEKRPEDPEPQRSVHRDLGTIGSGRNLKCLPTGRISWWGDHDSGRIKLRQVPAGQPSTIQPGGGAET